MGSQAAHSTAPAVWGSLGVHQNLQSRYLGVLVVKIVPRALAMPAGIGGFHPTPCSFPEGLGGALGAKRENTYPPLQHRLSKTYRILTGKEASIWVKWLSGYGGWGESLSFSEPQVPCL